MTESSVIEQATGPLSLRGGTGPDTSWVPPKGRNYLLQPAYRQISLSDIAAMSEEQAVQYIARVRWGSHGSDRQVCPECGSIDSHYWCEGIKRWKCKGKLCGKQFTVFSGTRFHRQKMSPKTFLSLLLHFVEAKDGISSRELSGLHGLNHQTAHVFTLKIREALRETLSAEPLLDGYVQADAAYFMKYRRPGNIGTGASLAAKKQQRNAGLDEHGRAPQSVSENMHALVVFVQSGPQGGRRYRVAVIKTENQVDLLTLGQRFCALTAKLVTDQHSAYNFFTGAFDGHYRVNHSREFMTADGLHTNYAEGFFARMRAAQGGAWHRLTLQYLEEYAWEFAWRQSMPGRGNRTQLEDLLRRVLNSGRATRFGDYWRTREEPREPIPQDDSGAVMEVDKALVPRKRGRPAADSVRPQVPEAPKRRYTRRAEPRADLVLDDPWALDGPGSTPPPAPDQGPPEPPSADAAPTT